MMGLAKLRCAVLPFVLSMLLGVAAALPGCIASAEPDQDCVHAAPVAEMTAVWGSFDEVRLFRYFDGGSAGIIPERAEYGGEEYVLAGTDGPFETQWGLCMEAVYARRQPSNMK